MTFRRAQAIALAQAKQQAEHREAVISQLAARLIAQTEQYLKEAVR